MFFRNFGCFLDETVRRNLTKVAPPKKYAVFMQSDFSIENESIVAETQYSKTPEVKLRNSSAFRLTRATKHFKTKRKTLQR